MICTCSSKSSLHDASCQLVTMRHVYYNLLDKAFSQSGKLIYYESEHPSQDHSRLKELLRGRWLGSTESAGEWCLVLDNSSEVRFVKKLA